MPPLPGSRRVRRAGCLGEHPARREPVSGVIITATPVYVEHVFRVATLADFLRTSANSSVSARQWGMVELLQHPLDEILEHIEELPHTAGTLDLIHMAFYANQNWEIVPFVVFVDSKKAKNTWNATCRRWAKKGVLRRVSVKRGDPHRYAFQPFSEWNV